jgi:transposase
MLRSQQLGAQIGCQSHRKTIHAIVDNYGTHKHPRVRKWLVQHPRWTFHFTPTSASWFNAIERPR